MTIDTLLNPAANFFFASSKISIGIQQTERNGFHCGILYKNAENGVVKFLHLAWHHQLLEETVKSTDLEFNYHWITPNLHATRQVIASAYCSHLFQRLREQPPIKYGLLYNESTFLTPEGKYYVGENCSGLTCATFVLAVFKATGITLIDVHNWQARSDDEKWHLEILDALRKTGAEAAHLENVSREKGCARFRPNEVAVSISFDSKPAKSGEIQQRGAELREKLQAPNRT